jgi:hypothetical protein
MSLRIPPLPNEVLAIIHQNLMDEAQARPEISRAAPNQAYVPFAKEQAARQAVAARARWARASKTFNLIDHGNLSSKRNSDVGCLVTKKKIENFSSKPEPELFDEASFREDIRS